MHNTSHFFGIFFFFSGDVCQVENTDDMQLNDARNDKQRSFLQGHRKRAHNSDKLVDFSQPISVDIYSRDQKLSTKESDGLTSQPHLTKATHETNITKHDKSKGRSQRSNIVQVQQKGQGQVVDLVGPQGIQKLYLEVLEPSTDMQVFFRFRCYSLFNFSKCFNKKTYINYFGSLAKV